MSVLGIDTSNYTTSVAIFHGQTGVNASRLLDVKTGELGLRQSDALFAHVKRLPELFLSLSEEIRKNPIQAIGVSTRPRAVEGSYMPCFLAGYSQAKVLATTLGVPLYEFSHQQGHIAASLWSANRMDLMQTPHLAWHLSGGTTELLLVTPDGTNVDAVKIGGTTDISAGQLIDRTGKLLQLPFPSGKAVDEESRLGTGKETFAVKCKESHFSLSGIQNKTEEFFARTHSPEETCAYVLRAIVGAISKATKQALEQYPNYPVVFSGGVASNTMLRETLQEYIFAQPQYSTDNAMGTAVLTWLQEG